MLDEQVDSNEAVYALLSSLKESNAVVLLQVDSENAFLHLIYKGKARGLPVWTNETGEVLFCSRPDPVEEELKLLLIRGNFKKKVVIHWQERAGLKLSFPAIFN